MQNTNTQRLVTTAVLVALAAVLSMIKIIELPLGGSITLLSMLPIVMLSIKYGTKWGLFAAFFYSLVQLGLDFGKLMSWGLTPYMWIGCIIFDYLVAFTALGLAGILHKKGAWGTYTGITLALVIRFISHFMSGIIVFGIWVDPEWHPAAWSFAYNGSYMLPELIFTLAASLVLFKLPQTKKLLLS